MSCKQPADPADIAWEARVQELENLGLTRSDAQGVADAEVHQGTLAMPSWNRKRFEGLRDAGLELEASERLHSVLQSVKVEVSDLRSQLALEREARRSVVERVEDLKCRLWQHRRVLRLAAIALNVARRFRVPGLPATLNDSYKIASELCAVLGKGVVYGPQEEQANARGFEIDGFESLGYGYGRDGWWHWGYDSREDAAQAALALLEPS